MRYICWVCVVEFELPAELERHKSQRSHITLVAAQATGDELQDECQRQVMRHELLDTLEFDKTPGSWIRPRVELTFCECILDWRVAKCNVCRAHDEVDTRFLTSAQRQSLRISQRQIQQDNSLQSEMVQRRVELENSKNKADNEFYENFRSILQSANKGHIAIIPDCPVVPDREFVNNSLWQRAKQLAAHRPQWFTSTEEDRIRASPLLRSTERRPRKTWGSLSLDRFIRGSNHNRTSISVKPSNTKPSLT